VPFAVTSPRDTKAADGRAVSCRPFQRGSTDAGGRGLTVSDVLGRGPTADAHSPRPSVLSQIPYGRQVPVRALRVGHRWRRSAVRRPTLGCGRGPAPKGGHRRGTGRAVDSQGAPVASLAARCSRRARAGRRSPPCLMDSTASRLRTWSTRPMKVRTGASRGAGRAAHRRPGASRGAGCAGCRSPDLHVRLAAVERRLELGRPEGDLAGLTTNQLGRHDVAPTYPERAALPGSPSDGAVTPDDVRATTGRRPVRPSADKATAYRRRLDHPGGGAWAFDSAGGGNSPPKPTRSTPDTRPSRQPRRWRPGGDSSSGSDADRRKSVWSIWFGVHQRHLRDDLPTSIYDPTHAQVN